ncbi:MAG: OmpA family protein [Prevotellaceae bacterium]|jgi:flagellar motor protein MotB|nr:OmpA family protein [Prevotellaceae bacterium]
MKNRKNLKVVFSLVAILLYSFQPGYAEFKILRFLQSKKKDPHCENCKFHTNNFYMPYTLDSLEYVPVSKANMMYDLDIDGDGVSNRFDDCPATFGTLSLKGCPPVDHTKSISYGNPTVRLSEGDFNLMVEIFSNLEFEGAQQSPDIKSQKHLDSLVKFLKKEKRLYLYISSYVNLGSNRMQNYYLSESRAQSVKNYIVKKGIDSYRIETLFFGDMMPVVDLPHTRFEVEICDKKKL